MLEEDAPPDDSETTHHTSTFSDRHNTPDIDTASDTESDGGLSTFSGGLYFEPEKGRTLSSWYRAVQDYIKRILTFSEDQLPLSRDRGPGKGNTPQIFSSSWTLVRWHLGR